MSVFATLEANAEKMLQHARTQAARDMAMFNIVDEETKHIIDTLETHILTVAPAPVAAPTEPTPTTPITEVPSSGVIDGIIHAIENLV